MMRKPDFVELGLVAAFSCYLGILAHVQFVSWVDELGPYRERYATQASANGEEWLIRDFFQDRRGGTFVDVGANHYRENSNTYYLETALGWSGLAIDPQPQFAADYTTHRPQTRYLTLFVSDRAGSAPLFVPTTDEWHGVASFDPVYAANAGGETTRLEVPTATLDTILEHAGIDRFDFLSMDIERHEPQALAGFSIDRYRPALACIEAHQPTRNAILEYFARHGYVLVGDYLRADTMNLWFRPLTAP